jgi:O-acetyl-ADP-ribose deacetylase (regulator of RNase III)
MSGYGSDWLIAASVSELQETIDEFEHVYGKPVKVPHHKINLSELATLTTPHYDLYKGDLFEFCQVLNGRVGIVNPANAQGLGCFQPAHTCFDNQLHRHEGPRLRLYLNKFPAQNDIRIAEGACIATPAFRLDIDAILHTVAPNCSSHFPTERDWNTLQQCYINCIHVADQLQLDYICFPAIGTGLYGFPKDKTAMFVHRLLSTVKSKVRVVLVTYTNEEYNTYAGFLR